MSCDQYQMFINLVQYYQMETRWSIKKLLLKTFTAACHLDYIIVDILLTSVLPLEIVTIPGFMSFEWTLIPVMISPRWRT